MIGIDLFAGAGGMSLGATLAGVNVQLAVEIDPHAVNTYRYNHPSTEIYSGDIRNFQLPNFNRNGQKLVVFGGPPCQGFSTSNQRTRTINNPNNWLWTEFLRIVEITRPDWVVFENVKGIYETEKGLFVKRIQEGLEKLEYKSIYGILNAVDFGVPQKRQRFFLIATNSGAQPILPNSSSKVYTTVFEAISDLPKLPNGANICEQKYRNAAKFEYSKLMRTGLKTSTNHLVSRNSLRVIDRYKYVPQGGNWEDVPESVMENYKDRTRCHTGIYHRLKADEPSIVIGNYRKNMLIHPLEDRGLSVREAARLQSFPDSYHFCGSIGFQQQQVGNSVPPMLAKAVFNTFVNQ